MRSNRLRKGLIVFNKVDGSKYKVTEVSIREGEKVGTAYEMVDDELTGKSVLINEKNALAFKALEDTEPYPIPEGYSVLDGKLMKDGSAVCDQGDVVVEKILAVQPDYLILAANKDKDGKINIMSYQVCCDRFRKLYEHVAEPTFAKRVDGTDTIVLAACNISEEECEKDGVVSTAKKWTGSYVLPITNGAVDDEYNIDYPITVDDIQMLEADGTIYIFVPSDEDDELNKRTERLWITLSSDTSFGSFYASNENEQFTFSWSHMYRTIVAKSDNELLVLKKQFRVSSPEIAKLKGYDHLIDITKGEYQYTLTFSNDEYELKALCSKSTKDRGYIVTVE